MNQGSIIQFTSLSGNIKLKLEFQQVDYLAYLFGFHGEHIFFNLFWTQIHKSKKYMPTFESVRPISLQKFLVRPSTW